MSTLEFEMGEVIQGYRQRLVKALGLSAQRGGFKGDLAGMVSDLYAWSKSEDMDFDKWIELVKQASHMWDEWYDWYSRTYTKPMEDLNGLTLEQWYEIIQSIRGDLAA